MKRNEYKSDTSINWNKATNFIPKKDEIIFYEDLNKFKIGNGKDVLKDLSFTIKTYNGERSYK